MPPSSAMFTLLGVVGDRYVARRVVQAGNRPPQDMEDPPVRHGVLKR